MGLPCSTHYDTLATEADTVVKRGKLTPYWG